MASALSLPGISSGLDVNAIVSGLMRVEQRPLELLKAREAVQQVKISAFGKITGALSALQTALGALSTRATLDLPAVSSSDDKVVTAQAAGSAPVGTYPVTVQKLAQAHALASAPFAAITDTVGSGMLQFEFGRFTNGSFAPNAGTSPQTVSIAPGASLSEIRDAINSANIGVSAGLVNDGSGWRLALTAAASGETHSLRVTVMDDDGNSTDAAGLSQLAYDPAAAAGAGKNLVQTLAAQDAVFSINGLSISRSSNTVSDAVDGMTLTLRGAGSAQLAASPDTATLTERIQAVVKAWNQFSITVADLAAYDPATRRGGPLLGDSALRTAHSQLRTLLGGAVPGLTGPLSALSSIGITFQKDGSVAVDSAKLANALQLKYAQAADVVSGVAGPLATLIRGVLDTQGGIGARIGGLNDALKRMDSQEAALQARMDAIEQRYRRQFTVLDANLARLNATQAALQAQLAALNKQT